ncbi:hypothetical protein [Ewingella americana]|uniref:hypothetical protein n=1 Tax=Ewingella americana TaxID=41202 RepID=UPI00163ABE4C|nr:hypothetical protein [Ewingella americana]QMV50942.1 hypothetical protein GXP68_05925 [Ewingella americana]
MIFIKNGNTFEKLNHWHEVEERDSFSSVIDLTGQKLLDVFGYYELAEMRPCGKSNCRTKHKKGLLVITDQGVETNIGHQCGFEAFGVEFENLAIELTKQANYHRQLTSLKEAKSCIFDYYQLKAKLESGTPSLEFVAHKILDMKDVKIIGRSAYTALKRMAGSGDGRVTISRKKSKEELSLTEVMSQKGFAETTSQNRKPEFENIIIGSVKHPEALLSDNDIAIIYERDIKIVLEQLSNCDPDTMKEKAVTSLGLKVSRLKERLQFAQERLDKARILITKDNLKPLSLRLHTQKSVSNQDKYLFKKFLESLPS